MKLYLKTDVDLFGTEEQQEQVRKSILKGVYLLWKYPNYKEELQMYNMKDLWVKKQENKNIFESRGIAKCKRSYIDENGEQQEEILKIAIKPPINDEYMKKFQKHCKAPKAPGRDILAVPSNDTPPIVLAVSKAVAVDAFPVNAPVTLTVMLEGKPIVSV